MIKPNIYLLLFVFCALFAQAQKDTLKPKTKPKKVESEFDLKNYKANPKDRLIFEVNHTNWIGQPVNIKPDYKGVGFSFSMLFDKPIGHSNFSFAYGLGLYTHNYSSNGNFVYKLDSINYKSVKTVLEPKTNNYKSNRYNEKLVEVPLEFRFRTKKETSFKMMLGAKIGYVFSNYRKVNDDDGKIRIYDIKNVNRLRYGVNFRIGVEQVCLTASYYFSEVFTENGPKGIHPFSIGIAIVPY